MPTSHYDEMVTVFSRDKPDPEGRARLVGTALQKNNGLWSWSGTLVDTDFEPGILMAADFRVRVRFDDGAEGEALVQNLRHNSSRGLRTWATVRLVSNGMPPRVIRQI